MKQNIHSTYKIQILNGRVKQNKHKKEKRKSLVSQSKHAEIKKSSKKEKKEQKRQTKTENKKKNSKHKIKTKINYLHFLYLIWRHKLENIA